MPNITMQNLGQIPGLQQAGALQQNGPYDCGAYATAVAVGAFGVFPVNAGLAYATVMQGAQPVAVVRNANIAAVNSFPQICTAIYVVTRILNPPPPDQVWGPVAPELLVGGNGYNSPAAMAQVVVNLGRAAPTINAQQAGFANLAGLYPGEQARCQLVVGQQNVNVQAGQYAAPGANEVSLLCVEIGNGLHWVAQGSDGNFYDPADGVLDHNWAAPAQTGDPVGPYAFAGLWMVIV
jgi:hypothetical protein